ncbi:MAG: ATP-dependent 6-phosphofructokinase, partial [Acidimicrobiia bacterium]
MAVIGVLTAGGDCPGLNAVIRAVVTRAIENHDSEVVGILNGWEGLMDGRTRPLDRDDVRGIVARGGTILGTSRKDPYVHGDGWASVERTIRANDIDTVVVIGGDGTLRSALKLAEEGLQVVGVPKTIDNDIASTDVTFGFDTAVQIATEAVDRIATTAEAHNRIMLVEVMGRTKGWIATYAAIAAGADALLIPEIPYDLEEVATIIRRRHRRGHRYSVVVVSEGVEPPSGE